MKNIKSIFILLIILFSSTFSQNKYFEKSKQYFFKEKMRISPSEVIKNIESLKNRKHNSNKGVEKISQPQLQSEDYSVSATANPESEIHAAINPIDSNNIVVSPIELKNDMFEPFDCPIYYTTDFGITWQKSDFTIYDYLGDGYLAGGGDPMFAFDKQGNAYFTWISVFFTIEGFEVDSMFNTMACAVSNDKGKSWMQLGDGIVAKSSADMGNGEDFNDFYDKQWMASDLSNSSHSDNVYLSLTHLGTNEFNIELYRKLKGNNQFEKTPTKVNFFNHSMSQFSNMAVDKNGNIHVIFWATENGEKNSLFHSVSTDGGVTFSKEIKITDFKISGANMLPSDGNDNYSGINPDRLYPCPQLAVDNSSGNYSGNLYITWTANGIEQNESKSLNVYFSKSTDGGKTWSKPKIVHDDNSNTAKYYPSISVNPDGIIVLTWYDRRNDDNNYKTDYYMAFSIDGGDTFTNNFPITSKATDFRTVGNLNSDFGIGEYNALVTTKGYAIPFWSDGRTNDGNLNVYTAFIPISDKTISVESINPINNQVKINEISPNPANDFINVSYSINKNLFEKATLSIYTVDSKLIRSIEVNSHLNTTRIDIADIPNGQYLLFLKCNGIYSVKKFIVNK